MHLSESLKKLRIHPCSTQNMHMMCVQTRVPYSTLFNINQAGCYRCSSPKPCSDSFQGLFGRHRSGLLRLPRPGEHHRRKNPPVKFHGDRWCGRGRNYDPQKLETAKARPAAASEVLHVPYERRMGSTSYSSYCWFVISHSIQFNSIESPISSWFKSAHCCWLVVSTPLKNISQLGWKTKNVPNQQSANIS